jgi:RNA-directed DNA polymerase
MNIEKPKRACTRASIDYTNQWKSIDWNIVKAVVNKLQSRIAKAVSENRINLVKKLQYLLAKSHYAKLLAIKRVTSNKGKRTSGIDKQLWTTESLKYENALLLTNKSYKSKPLKRIYIDKNSGKKKRPLGIPTMYDRAMQALYLLTLDPVAETILDKRSFGFRLHRGTRDASAYLFKCLGTKHSVEWVLEGDIKGCFDNISHKWIKENIIMDKRILNQFTKAGYIVNNKLYQTKAGTPQGGIISPTLANLTLNGMSKMLQEKYWKNSVGTIDRQYNNLKVNIAVYADDFVITASNKEILVEIKELISNFLLKRGLKLSKAKTLITHIREGFNFLGWNFRKFKDKLIIKPSIKSIGKVLKNIRKTIKKNLMQKQDVLIRRLNQIITGWCNYHKHSCAKKSFQTLDKEIFKSLWNWCKRRHPMKSKNWRKKKYFSEIKSRDWIFKSENRTLKFASDFKIKRHVLIKFDANPYLNEYKEYYLKRNLLNKGLV